MSLADQANRQAETDAAYLRHQCSSQRELRIADAACRQAFREAAEWLSQKQEKSELYPGGDIEGAKARAAAYQNAAQHMYSRAIPRD